MIPIPLWSRLPATALIAANLVVALITLLRGWGFYEIIIVYWCEAVIIGGFNMARMCMVGRAGEPFGKWIDAGNVGTRLFLVMAALAAGLVAAALLPALDTSAVFGVAIVLVKLAADLVMHMLEHAWLARTKVAA